MGFFGPEYCSGLPWPSPGDWNWPRDWTWVSCTAGRLLTIWATREVTSGKAAREKRESCFRTHQWPLLLASRLFKELGGIWDGTDRRGWSADQETWNIRAPPLSTCLPGLKAGLPMSLSVSLFSNLGKKNKYRLSPYVLGSHASNRTEKIYPVTTATTKRVWDWAKQLAIIIFFFF